MITTHIVYRHRTASDQFTGLPLYWNKDNGWGSINDVTVYTEDEAAEHYKTMKRGLQPLRNGAQVPVRIVDTDLEDK